MHSPLSVFNCPHDGGSILPVVLQHGLCLGFVGPQSPCDCLRTVIVSLDKRLPRHVIKTLETTHKPNDTYATYFLYSSPPQYSNVVQDNRNTRYYSITQLLCLNYQHGECFCGSEHTIINRVLPRLHTKQERDHPSVKNRWSKLRQATSHRFRFVVSPFLVDLNINTVFFPQERGSSVVMETDPACTQEKMHGDNRSFS